MNNIKKLFKEHCGDKYDKFMDRLYANTKGEIELFFWQEKLIESFLSTYPELKLDPLSVAESIRDGSEMLYKCPVSDCWGDVICLDYKTDLWGCGECGTQWKTRNQLFNQINKE